MNYIAVKDLKNSRSLREKLEKERELILTKDGKPFGLLIGIEGSDVEEALKAIRRAMFSKAVAGARRDGPAERACGERGRSEDPARTQGTLGEGA